MLQIHQTGTFKWTVNNSECKVKPLRGSGTIHLPFPWRQSGTGDTDAFSAPSRVAVHVTSFHGGTECKIALYDPRDGHRISAARATPAQDTVKLDSRGSRTAYLRLAYCSVQVRRAN